MYAELSTLEIAARWMIAFLFVFRAIHAMPTFANHAGRFRDRRIPFPNLVMAGGFATMLIGGIMVATDFHGAAGAIALIAFTVIANFTYHDFWAMEPGRQRDTHRNTFCNNIAVMGGLVMVIAAG